MADGASMLKGIIIATTMIAAFPALAQVRVITGETKQDRRARQTLQPDVVVSPIWSPLDSQVLGVPPAPVIRLDPSTSMPPLKRR